jgi:glycosyltransferase involved in cell wall biosynthesis
VWFTKILSSISSTLIYDFDDAIHLAPPGKSIDPLAVRRFNTVIKQSDLIVAGSRDLFEYAQQYSDDVVCLHTGIPQKKYLKNRNLDDMDSNSILLGWIGNPENLYYLDDIETQIDQILQSYDNIRLRIITGKDKPVRPFKQREGKDVEYIEWNLKSALADLAEADIGLRPLRDDEWTQAKGGFTSVVECLALGIPVVASYVGILKYLIEDEENGYLVKKPDEWANVLSTVAANPKNINTMRKKSIGTVSKYGFWSENTAAGLVRILRDTSRGS